MATLSQLGHVLTTCRVVSAARWQRAAKRGAGDLQRTLDALEAEPPEWWADAPDAHGQDAPPGLTDYQRAIIELWFDGGPPPYRQLALNRFLLLEKLGQGGQGEVYRARQLSPSRYVAVKTHTQDTDTGRQRFEQEARAMMRVRHPAVARFHLYERVRDADGDPTDEYLIAMEFVDGTDLHRLQRWLGPVEWPFVARWAAELLGGLAVIHHSGFIHRDVKPANVMIVGPAPEAGVAPTAVAAKLLDFGAVKPAEEEGGSGSRRIFVGTREYAPPEQWAEQVVPASDIYALGGTLFHALTGRAPYEVEGRDALAFMKAHTSARIPDVRAYNPDIPDAFAYLIRRMLSKDADDRGTAAELVAEFRELLPPEARTAESPALPPPPPVRTSKPAAKPRPPEVEADDEDRGAVSAILAVLERLFMPPRLRPPVGHEPPAAERVAALLRRPLVLVGIIVVLALLIIWLL